MRISRHPAVLKTLASGIVEPVWTAGYLEKLPAARVAGSHLYLCTTAQAYPRVTAWNTSVTLARDTVRTLLGDLGPGAPR